MGLRGIIRDAAYRLMSEEQAWRFGVWRRYKKIYGRYPNLSTPKSYSERLAREVARPLDPLKTVYADKIAVKDRIRAVAPAIVIPTLWTGERIADAPLDTLPRPYVIKNNHASGGIRFVRHGDPIEIEALEAETDRWLRQRFGASTMERHYLGIRPALLIEPMIGDGYSTPADHRFFVFANRVELIHVDENRFGATSRQLFDRSGHPLEVSIRYPRPDRIPTLPDNLEGMIELAETISSPFEFVRVDLYNIGGKIFFGEATFVPGAMIQKFDPASFDLRLGRLWGEAELAKRSRWI